jgi:hypothetical protein
MRPGTVCAHQLPGALAVTMLAQEIRKVKQLVVGSLPGLSLRSINTAELQQSLDQAAPPPRLSADAQKLLVVDLIACQLQQQGAEPLPAPEPALRLGGRQGIAHPAGDPHRRPAAWRLFPRSSFLLSRQLIPAQQAA